MAKKSEPIKVPVEVTPAEKAAIEQAVLRIMQRMQQRPALPS